ncbi:transposase domain-containing protein [Paenibacillus sanguinis]|uniref:transposase domain-containing protein n=1 Tax=Paenibacillus sanguinis TaxID=225906 RepID=UPI00037FAE3C|nr:transposase domain-containing protein [Paenibacillus sanguinis]
MGVLVSTSEAAELEGLAKRSVVRKIQNNKLKATQIPAQTSAKGYEYRIALSDLSAKAQARYYQQHQVANIPKPAPAAERLEDKSLEDLTERQRQQAAHWRRVLEEWRAYISDYPKQTTMRTKDFVEEYNRWNSDMPLTERTLRHKWKLYREYGEVALADGRADRADKGKTTISETAWSVFLQWWLDEGQPTTMHCYELLKAWAKLDMPQLLPLPSVDSFYRKAKEIPKPVIDYFRFGKKRFEDEAMPFVQRLYEWMDSNEVWVADFHTLDIFVRDDFTGRVYRPHVVAWLDVRSRKMMAITVCESSNSDGVISSFRKAVERYGIPKWVYLDNGREFLVSDFGGRGKRKTSDKQGYGATMLERMGVKMVNAKVANAKAKIIERAFRTFSEQFSKLILTYTGSSPDRKPHRLEGVLKKTDNIPLRSEIESSLWKYIEGWYNTRTSTAAGVDGLTRNEAYERNLITKRVATKEELNLMLLRTARLQSVDRNGVYLKFGETKLWYYSADLIMHYMKQKVFVRYNPEDLSTVRVDDEEGRFIMEATLKDAGGYGGEVDKEAIKRNEAMKRKQRENVQGYLESHLDIEAPSMMDVMMRASELNIEAEQSRTYDAEILDPVRLDNYRPAMAAGAEDNVVDMSRMIANAERGMKR